MRTLIPTAVLCTALSLLACSEAERIEKRRVSRPDAAALAAQPVEPYRVDNWYGTWTGTRPAYPLLNSNGEVIVVRGKEAKVGSSTFTFTIGAMGTQNLCKATMTEGSRHFQVRGKDASNRNQSIDRSRMRSNREFHGSLPAICAHGG